MTSQDCFGVAVRIAGLAAVLYGAFQSLTLIVALSVDNVPGMMAIWKINLVFAVASFVVGRYLLRGAPAVQRLAYPGSSQS